MSVKGLLHNFVDRFGQAIANRGLGRTLFFCFVFISFVPLAIVSRLSYENAKELLDENTEKSLSSAIHLKKEYLESNLSGWLSTLKIQSRFHSNILFLKTLTTGFRDSGMPLPLFVKSKTWNVISDKGGVDLRILHSTDDYYDILLLDPEGNVLFSAIDSEHLGVNLFSKENEGITEACIMATSTGRPVWSDLAFHGKNSNEPAIFMIQAMYNGEGENVGLIALGVPLARMNEIMKDTTGFGDAVKTFLVGRDLLMRSDSAVDESDSALLTRVETDLTGKWLDSLKRRDSRRLTDKSHERAVRESIEKTVQRNLIVGKPASDIPVMTYVNHRGDAVLGLLADLVVLSEFGVDWAIVAEIDERMAYSPAKGLQALMFFYMFATGIVVVLLAVFLTDRIVRPLQQLSAWARRVSLGDLTYADIKAPHNEIGDMNQSFSEVVESFQAITDTCEAISVGNLSKEALATEEHDVLGRSVNQMAEDLRTVVRQADQVAKGDYSIVVQPRSDHDELGMALLNMTDTLKNVTAENEKALDEARKLIENLDNLPSPVYTMDLDFNITYINPAAAAVVGLSAGDCLNAKCQGLFATPFCHTRDCPAEKVKMDDGVTTGENDIDPGGIDMPVEYTAAPIRDSQGNIAGILVHLSDITKRRTVMLEIREQQWLQDGLVKFSDVLRGEQNIMTLSQDMITFLATYLNSRIGALYLEENDTLKLTGSYAYTESDSIPKEFQVGEGLVGQAAQQKEMIVLSDIPDDYIRIQSALGEVKPNNIVIVPFLFNNQVVGVLELGSVESFTDIQVELLDHVSESIAIAVASVGSRSRLESVLKETRDQAEQLQVQQEELRQTNEELEEQTKALTVSEEELQAQQEELRSINEELEERTKSLEEQQENIRSKNVELEDARLHLEQKTEDLELASKYKSEFLANMSHELRTPLNSMLLLSKILAGNKEGNLSERQIEFADTINSAGADLLTLINEILDLSKVEAGKILLHHEDVDIKEFAANIEMIFREVAAGNDLSFGIELSDDLPVTFRTDRMRVEQIVKNFLSNAFKFTQAGSVLLKIYPLSPGKSAMVQGDGIVIAVTDTGIGIPKSKQELIFEEFKQADGTTTRKYGGTGLGLSISRRLAGVLGGEILVASEEDKGSTFMLALPFQPEGSRQEPQEKKTVMPLAPQQEDVEHEKITEDQIVDDDRRNIRKGEKSLLIIEDDPNFAKILADWAKEREFKTLVASNGQTGLYFADYYQPSAIILDIGLPGLDGYTVIERLKENPNTRHIPVHVISGKENDLEAMRKGAIGFLMKPVGMDDLQNVFSKIESLISKDVKKLLVVEDDEGRADSFVGLLAGRDVDITVVTAGLDAFQHLKSGVFDCAIIDLNIADESAFELLEQIGKDEKAKSTPVVVYSDRDLSAGEIDRLNAIEQNIIVKEVKSPERLLDEAALFLHRVEDDFPEDMKASLKMVHDKESILRGKKIMIVDDDMRNVFALTSVLEEKGMQVMVAKNGRECLDQLDVDAGINLILMDIMMPEVDGYEAMKEIRKNYYFKELPIIALTAKAMKGDKTKCIEAGASDYMAKPVDSDKLLSLLQVWLY